LETITVGRVSANEYGLKCEYLALKTVKILSKSPLMVAKYIVNFR